MKKLISTLLAVIYILALAAAVPAFAIDASPDLNELKNQVTSLFMDKACANLAYGVTPEMVQEIESALDSYPVRKDVEALYIYIDIAYAAMGAPGHDDILEPMTLSQRGNTWTERSRTLLWQYMYGYDITDRYARPGETIRIFADFDPAGPAPRVVFASAHDYSWPWYKGYDGQALKNGYNEIICTDMASCQSIFFYNPALPGEQAYPPTVRLIGGTKYPMYHYNTENPELSDSEEEFFAELEAYCEDVTDWKAEADSGKGKFNICGLVSDNMLVISSARAALKGLRPGLPTTNKVEWNGRTYQGPRDLMELYEGQVDFYIHTAGYNMDDPTHSDYRPRGGFQWRVYAHGYGMAWAAGVFVAFNTGDEIEDGDPLDSGYFQTILSPDEIVQPGWAVYHELGHVFDSSVLGKVEVTNNIFPMMAQIHYMRTNRYDYPSENRWRSITGYINTGAYNEVAYPLGLMVQLEAIDFSGTTLYPETDISNTGRAYRYARMHNAELGAFENTDDKLLISYSMAMGVNLTPVFDFYGVKTSDEARWVVKNLPLYEKPVQYIRTRAFYGGGFTEEQKNTEPAVTAELNMTAGTLVLNMDKSPYLDEESSDKNLLCYEIYKQDMTDDPNGEPELLGISSDDYYGQRPSAAQISALNLYKFTDTDIYPNHKYKYVVYAYDCELEKTVGKEIVVSAETDAQIPIASLAINSGSTQAQLTQAGPTAKLALSYSPKTTTKPFGEGTVTWTASPSGYVTIERDPEYPNDPSRFVASLNEDKYGSTETVTVTATIDGAANYGKTVKATYKIFITDAKTSLTSISLDRTSMSMAVGQETTLNVLSLPASATNHTPFKWESSNDTFIEVDDNGNVKAVGAGIATVTVSATDNFTGVTFSAVCTIRVYESAEGNASQVYIDRSLFHQDPDGTLWLTKDDFKNGIFDLKGRFTTVPENAQNKDEAEWSVIGGAPEVDNEDFGNSYPATPDLGDSSKLYYYWEGYFDLQLKLGDAIDTVRVEIRADDAPDSLVISDKANDTDPGDGMSEYVINSAGNEVQLYAYAKDGDEIIDVTFSDDIDWSTSNKKIVDVRSFTGKFVAMAPGTATVTAAYKGKTASCQIIVSGDPTLEYIRIPKRPSEMLVGDFYQIIAYPYPSNAKHLGSTVFELLSGEGVISLDKTGLVTALKPGTATVKATVVQNAGLPNEIVRSEEFSITVKNKEIPLNGVSISRVKHQMEPGGALTLSLTPRPFNANKGLSEVVWTSSDEAIATVEASPDGKAVVKAQAEGEVTVTGTMGGFSQLCEITIFKSTYEVPDSPKVELGWNGTDFVFLITAEGAEAILASVEGEEAQEIALGESIGAALSTNQTNAVYTFKGKAQLAGEASAPVSIYSLVAEALKDGGFGKDKAIRNIQAVNKVISDGGLAIGADGELNAQAEMIFDYDKATATLSVKADLYDAGIRLAALRYAVGDGEVQTAESGDNGRSVQLKGVGMAAEYAVVYLEDVEFVLDTISEFAADEAVIGELEFIEEV